MIVIQIIFDADDSDPGHVNQNRNRTTCNYSAHHKILMSITI